MTDDSVCVCREKQRWRVNVCRDIYIYIYIERERESMYREIKGESV